MSIEIPKNLIRLNANNKREIIDGVMDRARQRAITQLKAEGLHNWGGGIEHHRLCDKIYNQMFTPAERARLKKLPEGWVPTNNTVKVSYLLSDIPGAQDERTDSRAKGVIVLHFRKSKPLPLKYDTEANNWSRRGEAKLVDASEGTPLHTLVTKTKRAEQLNKMVDTAYSETRKLLDSIKTTKQLIETWPEVLTIMPKDYFVTKTDDGSASTFLTVQSHGINELIGIDTQR